MAAPRDLTIGPWPKGVNNVRALRDLPADTLRSAVNVDIPRSGRPRRRLGYSKLQAGNAHSLWAPENWPFALLVIDGQLSRLEIVDGQEVVTPLLASPASNRWRYTAMNDAIHASNGIATARISMVGALLAWGVENPGGQPTLSLLTGRGLEAGRYQVAITHVSPSGEESGAERAATIAVPADGGIQLHPFPRPDSGRVNIYCSPPNGEALYKIASISNVVTSFAIDRSHLVQMGRLLDTQFCDRVPPCSFLCSYRGRIYFAIGDTLYYTLALRFGLFKVHETYVRFPHTITGVSAVDNGIYVGTRKGAFFLVGNDAKAMELRPVDAFGVVENTLQACRATFGLDVPANELAAVWWSTNGTLMRGGPGGAVALTKGRLAVPTFTAGSLMVREQDQLQQLVSVLRGAENTSPLAARDAATVSVVRNGVVIN